MFDSGEVFFFAFFYSMKLFLTSDFKFFKLQWLWFKIIDIFFLLFTMSSQNVVNKSNPEKNVVKALQSWILFLSHSDSVNFNDDLIDFDSEFERHFYLINNKLVIVLEQK